MTDWRTDIPGEYHNQIVTGDARELAKRIPDESIDLIFTDPVYDRIDDYRWLAETAARVLKPDRALLVWMSTVHSLNVACCTELQKFLNLRWQFIFYMPGGTLISTAGWIHYQPLIWAEKGTSKQYKRGPDVFVYPVYRFKNNHYKWGKAPEYIEQKIDSFCLPEALIFDPFTGGGTVPAVCKMLNRNYIAFEIDPDIAELARERVLNTQPPLLLEMPKQMEIAL